MLHDPEWLPYRLDLAQRRVLLLRMRAAQREAAMFLDERGMPDDPQGAWVPLQHVLDAAVAAKRPRIDWIFHIGHCGSTLLSHLLAAWPEYQVLREPLPLRTLAEAWQPADDAPILSRHESAALLDRLTALWARPLGPHARSAIKATSSCNALIEPLLDRAPDDRAILLDMPLEPYLATLLKSPDSVRDVAAAAPARLRDLQARGIGAHIHLQDLDPPRLCATGWLAERLRFDALAAGAHRDRLLRVDFERLLSEPESVLRRIAEHLQLLPDGVPRALHSPWWRRYSKSGTHAYGVEDRRHDLALARERHGGEIAAGIDWVEELLREHPGMAQRVSGTGSARGTGSA